MSITYERNQYQIPRGRVFFDPFDANDQPTGERPFGNCPGVTINIESEKADHYSSETGLRQKDASVVVEVSRAGELQCDNWSSSNLELFLAGTSETVTQNDDPVIDEEHVVIQGRHYQLGRSVGNPAGARNVTELVVTSDDTEPVPFAAGVDYEVDLAMGRIRIVPGGAIGDGDTILCSYEKPAATWDRVKTGAVSELRGALRVIADNASGANRDWYMPEVTLTPNGELPVIAEGVEFVPMGFSLEVLKPANGEAIYVDGRPAT